MSKGKKRKKAARKPSGEMGFTRISPAMDAPEFQKVSFTDTKEEIEGLIIKQFEAFWEKQTGTQFSYKQNEQDDFDFALYLPGGETLLELTEIVFPNEAGGTPYRNHKKWMTAGEFADRAIATIANKQHSTTRKPLHLLTYITHWSFAPSETAIRLVQYCLRETKHPFENIFFLASLDQSEAEVRVLFPVDDKCFEGFDPEESRKAGRYAFDPRGWTLMKEPTSVEIKSSMVKDINVVASEDGNEVSFSVTLENGDTTSLAFPFAHLDWLQSKLLVAASEAFQRQVDRKTLVRVKPEDAAMTAEGFRVIEKEAGVALVQLIARADAKAPMGLGSFELNAELAAALSQRLAEAAERLTKPK